MRKLRVGLALGSGSARGWSHIGVIRALQDAGVHPDLVCGTSIGALVAAAYAAGELDRFEEWVLGMGVRSVLSLLDVRLGGGMLKGERLMEYFRRNFVDRPIEELAMPFGAVATALYSGTEVWLREGSTVEAVHASIALPALFAPVLHAGRVLVDGGLVNPVPVSLARAMGAEIVIAVDLTTDVLGYHFRNHSRAPDSGRSSHWLRKLQNGRAKHPASDDTASPRPPSLIEVVAASINVMQVRITRSRMAGDPPEAMITPRLAHLGVFDFHRGQEAIAEGRRAGLASLEVLRALGISAGAAK